MYSGFPTRTAIQRTAYTNIIALCTLLLQAVVQKREEKMQMEKIQDFTFLFDTLYENVNDRIFRASSPDRESGPRTELTADLFSRDTWRLVDRYLCERNEEAAASEQRLYRQGMLDCVSLLKELGALS